MAKQAAVVEAPKVETAPAAPPERCRACGSTVFELKRFCTIVGGKAEKFAAEVQCVGCGLKRRGQLTE